MLRRRGLEKESAHKMFLIRFFGLLIALVAVINCKLPEKSKLTADPLPPRGDIESEHFVSANDDYDNGQGGDYAVNYGTGPLEAEPRE